jgi:hypothetical protein
VVKPFTQLKFFFIFNGWLHTRHKHGLNGILGIAWVKQKVFVLYISLMYILNFFDNLEHSLLEIMSL